MPELPEVDRAAKLVKAHAQGKSITRVETNEDSIVFSGVTNIEFTEEIQGRKVEDVRRYGKVFFLELAGEGRMPVLHFGMTGNVIVKGEVPLYYKEGPKKGNSEWPPRFVKFILHLSTPEDNCASVSQIAFVDARRLGRIRLCKEPLKEPPISSLGFDPILSMPSLEDFSENVLRRKCPVKALLLDQSFSAGVGNWVAGLALFSLKITAVSVNADSNEFPNDWLFKHRWGKGKRKQLTTLLLTSGKPATIKWITVGGRTSAYVAELQQLSSSKEAEKETEQEEDEESDLTELSETEEVVVRKRSKHLNPQKIQQVSEELKKRKRQQIS
ncbi:hypothetical protein EW145_g432 [Phellinidium pouzarii]|uniref:DNA-formamidopyrimidine glycosylase n=1 Tax=Phellinidium pouzarii TaxID=167371 RepID=A0A4S4LIE2_9AGAM|nr:hypothetical protein EW145_g432 [Phellinidium pouzarii]